MALFVCRNRMHLQKKYYCYIKCFSSYTYKRVIKLNGGRFAKKKKEEFYTIQNNIYLYNIIIMFFFLHSYS